MAATAIARPASGVTIDPERLKFYREELGWSRGDLSDRVAGLFLDGHPDALPFRHRPGAEPADGHQARPALRVTGHKRLCTVCGHPVTGGVTRDAFAKIENERRRGKPQTLRAAAAALSVPGRQVTTGDLKHGAGPEPERSGEALERDERLEHNRQLRDFARRIGRPDLAWNDRGRVRYLPELERLFAKERDRDARREHNRQLREFARRIGRQDLAWDDQGRVRYQPELEQLYAQHSREAAASAQALAS